MPASVSASNTASSPISRADLPGYRPKGCTPSPTIATSLDPIVVSLCGPDRGEGVDHGLVAVGVDPERNDLQFHLLADPQLVRIRLGQPGLDPQRTGQFDVSDGERLEALRVIGAGVGRLGRAKPLRGEGPEGAPAG